MTDTLTKNERAALKSARQTHGHIRFQTWGHNRTQIEIVEGLTVVTQLTFDLSMSMEARGWLKYLRTEADGSKVFELTAAGAARAGRIR